MTVQDIQPGVSDAGRDVPSGTSRRQADTTFLAYLARKLSTAVLSFFATLLIGFTIFNLMPADPVHTLTRGRPTSPEQLAALRQSLGLDKPVWERFVQYLNNIVHFRLGDSWQFQQSVSGLIGDRVWPTVLLMGTSTVIAIVLGLWLGIRSGWRHGSLFDRISSSVSLTLWSVPTFWLGMILLVLF